MNRRFKFLRVLKILLLVTLFINAAGWITMYLWNYLVPGLFNGPVITFLQALGILLLSKILFGGFGRGSRFGGRRRWQQRMQERYDGMTKEEKENFKLKMQSRCGSKFRGLGEPRPVTE